MVESTNKTEKDEFEQLNELCGDNIRTYEDTIRIDMSYTQIKTATLVYRFLKDEETGESTYPAKPVFCELKSTTIPAKLISMFSRKLEAHIAELAKESKPQCLSAYQFISTIIEGNNLIPCFSEVPQIKGVIDSKKGDTLKPLEKAGKLKVTLKEGEKFANVEFEVPPAYPMQMVKFTLKEHNFNEIFAQMFENHTQNIIKRLWGGGPPGYDPKEKVDINEGKIGFKKNVGQLEADMAKIGIATRAELKHDLEYLNTMKQLKAAPKDK